MQSDKCGTFKSGCEKHAQCAQCAYYGYVNGGDIILPDDVDLDCSACENEYHDLENGKLLHPDKHEGMFNFL